MLTEQTYSHHGAGNMYYDMKCNWLVMTKFK